VQKRLGRSTIAMMMDTYGHLFPRGDDADELKASECLPERGLALAPPRRRGRTLRLISYRRRGLHPKFRFQHTVVCWATWMQPGGKSWRAQNLPLVRDGRHEGHQQNEG
jgi:hypothetical protein